MSNTFGKMLKVTVFGQSHSESIGVVIDGLPSGLELDINRIISFMQRRVSSSPFTTKRREADNFRIISGLVDNITCGASICAVIDNTDTRSKDYDKLRDIPRPMHADYPAYIKYSGYNDIRGGGQFSGRMTAPICFAGAVAEQFLSKFGIFAVSHISSIGNISDDRLNNLFCDKELINILKTDNFPVINTKQKAAMLELINTVASRGDSIGGAVETVIYGVPTGLGEPMFDSIESKISHNIFGIPAVKGIDFGAGFDGINLFGSEYNDSFVVSENGSIATKTNNHGGILGGISTGMPINYRAIIKPTPSIALAQDSISLTEGINRKLVIEGRHDSCIVSRAVPSIEAMGLLAIADLIIEHRRDEILSEFR